MTPSVKFISATDVAIALAMKEGTLRTVERPSRFGGTYWTIEDQYGLIDVALTAEELEVRLAGIREKIQ